MNRLNGRIWGSVFFWALACASIAGAQERWIKAYDMTIPPGQTNSMLISFNALGDEAAVGFSLCWDPALLTYVRASTAEGLKNAQGEAIGPPSRNALSVSEGRLGLSLVLLSPGTFIPGSNAILMVYFKAAPSQTTITTPISITCYRPISNQVVQASADEVPASWFGANVTIQGSCSFALARNSDSFTPEAGNAVVGLTAGTCGWSIVNTNPWITINSSTNGTGDTNVSYTVAANTSSISRTGTVTIAELPFTVTQTGVPCSYTLSTTSIPHGAGAETGHFDVTAPDGCGWTPQTTNMDWIHITSESGTGNGTVSYSVTANTTSRTRSGAVTIAGKEVAITQAGVACNFTLSATAATYGPDPTNSTIEVRAAVGDCAWAVTAYPTNWVTLNPLSGVGSKTVDYSIAANPDSGSRTGAVVIAGQTFTLIQNGTGCEYTVPNLLSHGSGLENGVITLIASSNTCPWQASTTDGWITLLSTSGTGSIDLSYRVDANLSSAPRTGAVVIANQTVKIRQDGLACSYLLSPAYKTHGYGAGVGSTTIKALPNCTWTAVSLTTNWLTIQAGSGTGSGTSSVFYVYTANPSYLMRTGYVDISGQTFTVYQRGQTPTPSPATRNAGYAGSSNYVTIRAAADCVWSAVNTNSWINIVTGSTGTGTNDVGFVVLANPYIVSRTGLVQIVSEAGNTNFTVTQDAGNCSYAFSTNFMRHSWGQETGQVSVFATEGCAWSAGTTNDWITILPGSAGSGNGSVSYQVAPNPTGAPRTGYVNVDKSALAVQQEGVPCIYTLSTNAMFHSAARETGFVSVSTTDGCVWTSRTPDTLWITILNASSTGVTYRVEANMDFLPRTGSIIIQDKTVSINQAGFICAYALSPAIKTNGYGASTGSTLIKTTSNCTWTAVSLTTNWLSVLPESMSRTGTTNLLYAYAENPSVYSRTGYIEISGQVFTVVQSGAPFTLEVGPANRNAGWSGSTNFVTVTAAMDCPWSVENTNPWIHIVPGYVGTGTNDVGFLVDANTSSSNRIGFVRITNAFASASFTVTQEGATCDYTLSTNRMQHSWGQETGRVSVTAVGECVWTATTSNDWIMILPPGSGVGSGSFSYMVSPNPIGVGRTGLVDVVGQILKVVQAGIPCEYTLSATNVAHEAGRETNIISINTTSGCPWSVEENISWISILGPSSGTGSNVVMYRVDANTDFTGRTGVVTIANQLVTISQAAYVCDYKLSPTNRNQGSAAGTNYVTVKTGASCPWTAVSQNTDWLTIVPGSESGMGTSFVYFAFSARTNTSQSRTGTIDISGQTLMVVQDGVTCDFSISPTNTSRGSGASSNGTIAVSAKAPDCIWEVAPNTNSWITILGGASGCGTGVVSYAISANPSTNSRSGTLTVAGITFNISQDGGDCQSAELSKTSAPHSWGTETGQVSVTTLADCPWVVTNNKTWINILSGSPGLGNGTVVYEVLANSSSLGRTGTVSIAGKNFAVQQEGAPCLFALSTNQAWYTPGAVTDAVSVATLEGCTWQVEKTNDWITILSASGLGEGVVSYALDAYTGQSGRTGVVMIAEKPYTIVQTPMLCAFSFSPSNRHHGYGATNATFTVRTTSDCEWSLVNTNPWISFPSNSSGTGSTLVTYLVEANTGMTNARVGWITLGSESFMVTQDGVTCSWSLSASERTHEPAADTNTIDIVTQSPCGWSVINTNTWIRILEGASGTGPQIITYAITANPIAAERRGTLVIGGQTFIITQRAAPCIFSLNATNFSFSGSVAAGRVDITAVSGGCSWLVQNTNDWIKILNPSGVSNGVVNFTIEANPTILPRTGTVVVANISVNMEQAGADCSYSLSPTSIEHSAGLETGRVAVVTLDGCDWSVESFPTWVQIVSGSNGTSSGVLTYKVDGNPSSIERTGVVVVAGQNLTLRQAGASCSYALSETNLNYSFETTNGIVDVATVDGCVWNAATTNNWITITSPPRGTNSGSVGFLVASNGSSLPRTGMIAIEGQSLLIAQDGAPCSYAVSGTNQVFAYLATNGTVSVTTLRDCVWTIENTNQWIKITSGNRVTNSDVVAFTVSANPSSLPRSAEFTVAGATCSITQDGAPCVYSLSRTQNLHSASAETGQVQLITLEGCEWSVESHPTWVQILAGNSGTGSRPVTYSVEPNPSSITREGVIRIAGQSLSIRQTGTSCSFALSVTNLNYSYETTNGIVDVATVDGCVWNVTTTNNWITITSPVRGTNNGSVAFLVASNGSSLPRTGMLTLEGQSLFIVQAGAPCSYALSGTNQSFNYLASNGTISVSTLRDCVWTVENTNEWIQISSGVRMTNSDVVAFTVSANPSSLPRTAEFTVAETTCTITQDGAPCSYSLSPTQNAHGAGIETGLVSVVTLEGCDWSVASHPAWLQILSVTNGTGPAVLTYRTEANPSSIERTGVIAISGQNLTIRQAGATCTFGLSVTNLNYSYEMTNGIVDIVTIDGCVWNVATTNNWITITSPLRGTNSGSVAFLVASNGISLTRTGMISIEGLPLTIVQANPTCNFAVSETNQLFGYLATNGSVTVATLGACVWTVENTNRWIQIASGTSGTNSGEVLFTIAANPSSLPRTAEFTVAGQTCWVTQDGAPCVYSLSQTENPHGAGTETGQVQIITWEACDWSVTSHPVWMQILSGSNGTGSGVLTYRINANPSSIERTGVVVVAGQNLTLRQAGATCTYALSLTNLDYSYETTNGIVDVATVDGCVWNVTTTNNWITFTSPVRGTNSGSVTFLVASNGSSLSRTGMLTIEGKSLFIVQAGAPCSYAVLGTNQIFVYWASNGTVSVSTLRDCVWTVENTNEWIQISSGVRMTNSDVVAFTVSANPSSLPRSAEFTVAEETCRITQDGAPCVYSLSRTQNVHSASAETGQVQMITLEGCEWSVESHPTWVQILAGNSGTGTGLITYSVEPNPSSIAREGVIRIAGQDLSIRQTGATCTFALSLTNLNYSFEATNGIVDVATVDGCVWNVTTTNNWITITSPLRGTNSGSVGFLVASNGSSLPRTGILTIEGQSSIITQAGAPCSYAVSGTNQLFGYLGTNGTISVTTLRDCVWTVENTNQWIEITSGNRVTNSDVVAFTVSANPSSLPRTAEFTVAGATCSITQDGAPCSYSLSPTQNAHGAGIETGLVSVVTLEGCDWSVAGHPAWLQILSATNGTGPRALTYRINANSSSIERTGVVVIAGQNLTVRQAGATCTYALNVTNLNYSFETTNGIVDVATLDGCVWNAATTNDWITITSPVRGTNNGSVGFLIASNGSSLPRTGMLTIEGQSLFIVQAGALCSYAVLGTNQTFGYLGTNGTVSVTTLRDCVWTIENTNQWIRITSGVRMTNSDVVAFAVSANPSSLPRTAEFTVAGQTCWVTQDGAPCIFTLSETNEVVGFHGTNGSLTVTTPTACTWEVVNTNLWITMASGFYTNTVAVPFTVEPNPSSITRIGLITLGGQLFTIVQSGADCTYSLSAESASFGCAGTNGAIGLTTPGGCPWTAQSTNGWIRFGTSASGSGNGNFTYTVEPNLSSLGRTGFITVGGHTFTIHQSGVDCTYSLGASNGFYTHLASTGRVEVTTPSGCVWYVTNAENWITLRSGTSMTNSGTVVFEVAENVTSLLRTGMVMIAGQTFTVVQDGVTCSYTLTPQQKSHDFAGGTGSVSVTTPWGCAWSVVSTSAWVVVNSTSFTNSGGFSYTVLSNGSSLDRRTFLNVSGTPFEIDQSGAPCTFALSATNYAFDASAGSASVLVSTIGDCQWSISKTSSWVTIDSPLNNTNSAAVNFRVEANPTGIPRTTYLTLAGRSFQITQAGANCTYVLGTNHQNFSYLSNNGVFSLTTLTGCTWTVINTSGWVNVTTPSGSNSAMIAFGVASNTTSIARSTVLTVGNQEFLVAQDGVPCTYALSQPSQNVGYPGTNWIVAVTTPIGCTWSVGNTCNWVVVSSELKTNSDAFTYTVLSNDIPLARSAVLTINDQTFTINQSAAPCSFALSETNFTFEAAPGTGTLSVTTFSQCQWSISKTSSWVTIDSPMNNNTGNGTVNFRVDVNPTGLGRTSIVMIANAQVKIAQAGALCTYALNPPSQDCDYRGTNAALINVTTLSGCTWGVQNTSTWINVTGTNNGTVTYTVLPNTNALTRSAVLSIGGQLFTVTQTGADCVFNFSPTNRIYDYRAASGSLSVTTLLGCTWTVINTSSWVNVASGLVMSNTGSFSYGISSNGSSLTRSTGLLVGDRPFTITQSGAPCNFSLNDSSDGVDYDGGSGSVDLRGISDCPWSIVKTSSWIHIDSPLSGTGPTTVLYSVDPNNTGLGRTSTVVIANLGFKITQEGAPCTFVLGTNQLNFSYLANTGTVTMTTLSGCSWSVVKTSTWITVTSPLSNNVSGTVVFTVAANPTTSSRTSVMKIGGQTLTVYQDAMPCFYSLIPSSHTHSNGAESLIISVTSSNGCPWNVINTNVWVTIKSGQNGTNSGTVRYNVDANPSPTVRTGYLTIANQTYTILQIGSPCSYALQDNTAVHGYGVEEGVIALSTDSACEWRVINTNDWIAFTAATNGFGGAAITYLVGANPSPVDRTGWITVENQAFMITQLAAPCSFTLSAPGASFSGQSGTGTVSIATSNTCSWTITKTNTWITITSPTTGTGPQLVTFSVASNTNSIPRTGVVKIADQDFTITQAAGCTYTLSYTNRTFLYTMSNSSVTLTTGVGCTWTLSNTNTWITFTNLNGTNTTTLNYTVAENPTSLPRSGVVFIGNQPLSITQSGALCNYSLPVTSFACTYPATSSSLIFNTLIGCTWSVVNTSSWVTLTTGTNYTNSASVLFSVAANPNSTPRNAVLVVGGLNFNITQSGMPCNYTLATNAQSCPYIGTNGSVAVTAVPGCTWDVINTNAWISINSPLSVTNSGTVIYTVLPNTTSSIGRTGVVSIAEQSFTFKQSGAPCTFVMGATSDTYSYVGTNGTVSVTTLTGCPWSVINTSTWLTVTSPQQNTNSGTVSYTITTNTSIVERSTVLVIDGHNYTVTQRGAPCTYTLTPDSGNHGSGVESGSFTVTSLSGCNWSVIKTSTWVTITTPSGSGNGEVGYLLESNATPNVRMAVLVIEDQKFTIVQSGSCFYAINPQNRTVDYPATNGTVSVIASNNCTWSVYNTNTWITITGGASGTNNGTVSFTVQSNPSSLVRVGTLLIAGLPFTLTQFGVPCTYLLTPAGASYSAVATNGQFSITTPGGCPWTVANSNNWITVTSPTRGTNNGTVTYTVDANLGPARSGNIVIGTSTFTVNQAMRLAPVLAAIGNKRVTEGTPLTFTASAITPEPLSLVLSFSLDAGAPSGATVNPTTGVFTWTPTEAQGPSTNSVTIRVTDNGSPNLNDYEAISIIVDEANTAPELVVPTVQYVSLGNTLTFTSTATDADLPPQVLTYSLGANAPSGASINASSGLFTWSPTDVRFVGTNTVTIRVTDNGTPQMSDSHDCMLIVTQSAVRVSGFVYYPTGALAVGVSSKRCEGVALSVIGGTNVTTQSLGDGSYSFLVNANGNYTLTPQFNTDSPIANGVSTIDISLIRRHILGITNLDSPYKVLAGDVNGSSSVTTMDISWIRKLVLGLTNTFPAGLWRFVPADYVFTNALNPWTAPAQRTYTNLSGDRTNQNFVAIKLGDVNASWVQPVVGPTIVPMIAPPQPISGPEVTFQITGRTNVTGDTVLAQIAVRGFQQVSSAQFSIAWDPAVLAFAGTGNYGLKGLTSANFGLARTSNGILAFSWDDPNATGVSLVDDTVIFTVNFVVIANDANSALAFIDTPTWREVGVNFEAARFRSIDGNAGTSTGNIQVTIKQVGSKAVLNWNATPGKTYQVLFTTNIADSAWITLPDAITSTGTNAVLEQPITTNQQIFYRIIEH